MKEGQETNGDKQVGCHADVCGGCENAALPLISPSPRQHQTCLTLQLTATMEGRGDLLLEGKQENKAICMQL